MDPDEPDTSPSGNSRNHGKDVTTLASLAADALSQDINAQLSCDMTTDAEERVERGGGSGLQPEDEATKLQEMRSRVWYLEHGLHILNENVVALQQQYQGNVQAASAEMRRATVAEALAIATRLFPSHRDLQTSMHGNTTNDDGSDYRLHL